MKTLEDLYAEREALDKQIEEVKKSKIVQEVEASRKYRASITPEVGQWLLDHMEHTCGTCERMSNGFSYYSTRGYDCPKCALEEYLEDELYADDFEMAIDVYFRKIREE